jgi:hypothetical protein
MYTEIPNGAVAKSYLRKGFLIYEEMRKYLTINCSHLTFPIYDFLFYQCTGNSNFTGQNI